MDGGIDVALISMPFGPLFSPSIGLGLLKAALARIKVQSKIFYFTFRYAETIGECAYTKICDETFSHDLVGEWIFSGSLFQQADSEVEQYLENVLRPESVSEDLIIEITNARNNVEAFLDQCLDQVLECRPRMVGFTSIFQQHVASLALAKRIRANRPDAFIVLGGANCEGVMGAETLRQFCFVDAVVSGEADLVFPELVSRVLSGEPISHIQGVFNRQAVPLCDRSPKNAAAVENLDALPVPDYDDYFEELSAARLGRSREPSLLFETSRGCWWGEKHHCTFCGLNGQTMAHRRKSARRAMDELVQLTNKYPRCPVNVVDNILDMGYFKDFIPMLAERKLCVEIFYEVKANLKQDQVRLLRDAGITAIQPGIESLSDAVLRIMRKGVCALQNIRLLKWCRQFGVTPQWNFIWGFPGEPPEDYQRMATLVPLLTHLPPPQAESKIRIDRFSPNFNQSEELGFKNLSPYPAYGYVYLLASEAIANLAYFFKFEYAEPRDVMSYVKPLAEEIARWRECHSKSYLFWIENRDRLLIWDSRPVTQEHLTALTGFERFCYAACDNVGTAQKIRDLWQARSGKTIGLDEISAALEVFTRKGLMIAQGDRYLSLAVAGQSEKSE